MLEAEVRRIGIAVDDAAVEDIWQRVGTLVHEALAVRDEVRELRRARDRLWPEPGWPFAPPGPPAQWPPLAS